MEKLSPLRHRHHAVGCQQRIRCRTTASFSGCQQQLVDHGEQLLNALVLPESGKLVDEGSSHEK
jgi:hypothetical protein